MYMQKNEIFLNFVREMRGFESKEWLDWENYNDYKSIITIIVLGLGNQKRKRKIIDRNSAWYYQ